MNIRTIIGAVAIALTLSSAADAGYVFTQARRTLSTQAENSLTMDSDTLDVFDFDPLDDTIFSLVDGAWALARIRSTLTSESMQFDVELTLSIETVNEFSDARGGAFITFELAESTTIEIVMTEFGSGINEILGSVSASISREGQPGDVWLTEGTTSETITLDAGIYTLGGGLAARRDHLANALNATAFFSFTIIPAPATLAALPMALWCSRRRRRCRTAPLSDLLCQGPYPPGPNCGPCRRKLIAPPYSSV